MGGGTSGSVIASRLSENPNWKILLLEAGGEESCVSQVPSMHRQLQRTPYAWGYWTVPQNTTCLGNFETTKLEKTILINMWKNNFIELYL